MKPALRKLGLGAESVGAVGQEAKGLGRIPGRVTSYSPQGRNRHQIILMIEKK